MPRLFLAEQSALSVGGHYYAYTRTIASSARRLGLDVTIIQNRRFQGDWDVPGASVREAFHHTWGEAEHLWIRDWKPGNIAHDFLAAVEEEPPGRGDHVLFSTLSLAELRALMEYFIRLPVGGSHPTYHLLLRYDPDILESNLQHYRALFDTLAKSALLRRLLRFHTDTKQLSDSYTRLTGLEFTTLPIPFAHEHLLEHLAARKTTSPPLTVAYLGDARIEKNFALLPQAVEHLWADYVSTGRLRFVFQSNFNTEGGEAGMLQAVQRLGQFPSDTSLELIDHALDASSYYRLLAEADIVLIPYDARRYRARSSGVLIEAMAAGKPVVTSRHSWMETQVTEEHAVLFESGADLGPAIAKAVDNFNELKLGAEKRSPDLLRWSSGENFVHSLLATVNTPTPDAASPRVLLVVDGEALILRNGTSVVVHSQMRYLSAAGYRVTVLALVKSANLADGNLDHSIDQIRSRLKEYELEDVFLVGTGRLSFDTQGQSYRRSSPEHSIKADASAIATADVNLALLSHIRANRPDVVLLNYVVNFPLLDALGLEELPVICETVDIQSFQKAIYGKRRVSSEDLRNEADLLRRCRHILAISPSEAEYMKRIVPGIPVTMTGIYPQLPRLGVRSLSGPTSLGELISSCGPELPIYRWEQAWESGTADEVQRLGSKASIDLIYVSSSHAANVAGLRWFLDEIYLPFLAPVGVTMVVAGSICEWGGWPRHENLFFVGRLARLDPLYAAARVVVLPVTEGAGAAVKTLEALAYGRPVVATPTAMRGIQENIDGVVVTDAPDRMHAAIVGLLGSREERQRCGAATRSFACETADPQRHAMVLDDAFKTALGERATKAGNMPRPLEHDQQVHLEWSPLIVRVNRLIWQWLNNEPLERESLLALLPYPEADVAAVVRGVCRALLVDRDASVLDTERKMLQGIAPRLPEEAGIAEEVILAALALTRLRGMTADAIDNSISIVYEPRIGVNISVLSERPRGSWQPKNGRATSLFRDRVGNLLAGGSLPQVDSKSSQACGVLTLDENFAGAVVRQTVRFDSSGNAVGHTHDQGATAYYGGVLLRPRTSLRVLLPAFFSPAWSGRVFDLVLDGDAAVEVIVEGNKLIGRRLARGPLQILRLRVPDLLPWPTEVELVVLAGSGRLVEIANNLLIGRDGDEVIALLDRASAIGTGGTELVGAGQTHEEAREELAECEIGQRPISYQRLLALGSALEDNEVGALPLRSGMAPPALLNPRGLLESPQAGEVQIVASCGLTMEVHVVLQAGEASEGVKCLVDGRPAEPIGAPHETIWRANGRGPSPGDSWLRRIKVVRENGDAVAISSIRAIFRFVAGLDRGTGDTFVAMSNAHEPMILNQDVGLVWTGPYSRSKFTVPVFAERGHISVDFANLGENRDPDDLRFEVNGKRVESQLTHDGDKTFARLPIPENSSTLAVIELTIIASRLHSAPGDPRKLGVAINALEFVVPLSPVPALDSGERAPPEAVSA